MLLEEGVRHRLGTMKPRPAVEAMNEIQVISLSSLYNLEMRFRMASCNDQECCSFYITLPITYKVRRVFIQEFIVIAYQ